MIYRCNARHISFAKELRYCGMKGCGEPVDAISNRDIEWFYKINEAGLTIDEMDLPMIIKDKNMPDEVKRSIKEVFPGLWKRGKFW